MPKESDEDETERAVSLKLRHKVQILPRRSGAFRDAGTTEKKKRVQATSIAHVNVRIINLNHFCCYMAKVNAEGKCVLKSRLQKKSTYLIAQTRLR